MYAKLNSDVLKHSHHRPNSTYRITCIFFRQIITDIFPRPFIFGYQTDQIYFIVVTPYSLGSPPPNFQRIARNFPLIQDMPSSCMSTHHPTPSAPPPCLP